MKLFSIIPMVALATLLLFASCKKNDENIFSDYEIVDQNTNAFIKINYNVAFYNNPEVQVKINGTRVSGSNIQTRYPFPGGGFNTLGGSTGDYLPIVPGNTEISISIPKKGTSIDSLNIYTTTLPTVRGKKYTLHVADSLVRKSLAVEEDASLPDSGFVRYRFVNLMPNVSSIDLYNGTVKVASSIPFMAISANFVLPTSASTTNVWDIRVGGSAATSTVIATYTSSSTILNQRVYTAFANGYNGYSTSGKDVRKPYLSFYYVR